MRTIATVAIAVFIAAGCAGKGHTQSPDAQKVNNGLNGAEQHHKAAKSGNAQQVQRTTATSTGR